VANDVIASVGLPTIQPAPETFERLMVITPRRIILESEEEPILPGSHVEAGRKPQ
jgi:hypothetical protein